MDDAAARARAWIWIAGLVCAACGGGHHALQHALARRDFAGALRSYDAARAAGDADRAWLVRVAAAMLEDGAQADAPGQRALALAELQRAGEPAEPVLERLLESSHLDTRVTALYVLARRGRRVAREVLGRLDLPAQATELRAMQLAFVDPVGARAALRAALSHPSGKLRAAAVEALGRGPRETPVCSALSEVARLDPLGAVRARALAALARGCAAGRTLEAGLRTTRTEVRTAAARALLIDDPERGTALLGEALAGTPSSWGVEVARLFLQHLPGAEAWEHARAQARQLLVRALDDRDAHLRAQAAVSLRALPAEILDVTALAAHLDREADPRVRLALALALQRHPNTEAAARRALQALSRSPGMPGLQAAIELAPRDQAVRARLRQALTSDDEAKQRSAIRAAGTHLRDPHALRPLLEAPRAWQRYAAAGAVLVAGS